MVRGCRVGDIKEGWRGKGVSGVGDIKEGWRGTRVMNERWGGVGVRGGGY